MVSVILKKIYILFLFINVGIIILVSVILKKIEIIFIHNYLCCYKIPKGYSSNSSSISDYVNIVEITSTQQYTRLASNRFPGQKMLENNRMETVSKPVTRFDIEATQKNPRGELIDISLILKVKSTSKFPCRIDVIISTWICLSKSMKSQQTFYLEFRRRIDGKSTKMCPLGWYITCVNTYDYNLFFVVRRMS